MELLNEAVDSGVGGAKGRLKELRVIAFWDFDQRFLRGPAVTGTSNHLSRLRRLMRTLLSIQD